MGGAAYKGLMCYCADEAHYLASRLSNMKDIVIAYPTVQTEELELVWDMVTNNDVKVQQATTFKQPGSSLSLTWP